jgi:hypothetical protein
MIIIICLVAAYLLVSLLVILGLARTAGRTPPKPPGR